MTNSKQSKATPGKWIMEKLTNGEYMIRGGDAGGVRIGRVFDSEDAAFICHAVNNFCEFNITKSEVKLYNHAKQEGR